MSRPNEQHATVSFSPRALWDKAKALKSLAAAGSRERLSLARQALPVLCVAWNFQGRMLMHWPPGHTHYLLMHTVTLWSFNFSFSFWILYYAEVFRAISYPRAAAADSAYPGTSWSPRKKSCQRLWATDGKGERADERWHSLYTSKPENPCVCPQTTPSPVLLFLWTFSFSPFLTFPSHLFIMYIFLNYFTVWILVSKGIFLQVYNVLWACSLC